MTERELILEIRRGLITIMKAVIRYAVTHGMELAWADFLPREENAIIQAMATRHNLAHPMEDLTRVE